MDADTCNYCGPVLEAEGGEVQTAGEDKKHNGQKEPLADGLFRWYTFIRSM